MLFFIVVLSAILLFIVINLLLTVFSRGGLQIEARMQRYANLRTEPGAIVPGAEEAKQRDGGKDKSYIRIMVRILGSKLRKAPQAKDFDLKMQQAGLPLFGGEFLVVLGGAALVVAIISFVFTHDIIKTLLIGISTAIMILVYVSIRIKQRRKSFTNQLGDALVMMANSMRSGFSFMQAVDMVANEMTAPISVEFAKLVGEMRLGIPTEEALDNISKRVGSKDFDLVIIAVMIQRQVGGNLSQILETISMTIMERIKMKREISTLTAQGRMSGWVVGLLPMGMGLILHLVNPHYLTPMFTDPIGQMAVGAGIFTQLIGIFCIMKIVDIEA